MSSTINLIEKDYPAALSMGKLPGCKVDFKFGQGLVTTSLTTVWSGSAERPGTYVRPNALGETLYISSASAQDKNITGTGAWSITLQGQDANQDPISEDVIMNGQTPVATVKQYSRICRVNVKTAASASGTVGDIYVGAAGGVVGGVPTGNIYAKIEDGGLQRNQSQSSCFTVPRGYTLFIYGYEFSAAAVNKVVNVAICTREPGGVWRARSNIILRGGAYSFSLPIPLGLPEKTDIEIRAYADTGTDTVTGSYLYTLHDNASL